MINSKPITLNFLIKIVLWLIIAPKFEVEICALLAIANCFDQLRKLYSIDIL